MPESDELEPELPKATPMSLAVEWVARITAVSLVMALPAFAGQWLDSKVGTEFLVLVGLGFGFCAGFVGLLAMVNKKEVSGLKPEAEVMSSERHERTDGESGER